LERGKAPVQTGSGALLKNTTGKTVGTGGRSDRQMSIGKWEGDRLRGLDFRAEKRDGHRFKTHAHHST